MVAGDDQQVKVGETAGQTVYLSVAPIRRVEEISGDDQDTDSLREKLIDEDLEAFKTFGMSFPEV